ncbi:hypothetical protein ELY33_00625, partial [Vreelandella andesensis]
MNNVFRLIWNRTLGRLVVTSEAARSNDKSATQQGVVGQLPAPEAAAKGVPALLRPAVIAVALAAGSMMLVAPGAQAGAIMGADTCADYSNRRIAIGVDANACHPTWDTSNIAIGEEAKATGNTIVLTDRLNPYYQPETQNGGLFNEVATSGVALGQKADAGGAGVAVGGYSNTGVLGVAIGAYSKAGQSSLALGPASGAIGASSSALGRQSFAGEAFAQAIGTVSAATGISSLAVGHSATATGDNSISIGGAETTKTGINYNDANKTFAQGQRSIALGAKAQSLADDAIALGSSARAGVLDGAPVGATALNAFAMGNGAKATGDNAMALGAGSWATGSVAIGNDAANPTRAANGGTAVGDGAQATWNFAGDPNVGPDNFDIAGSAYGESARANNSGATALGANANAEGVRSVAVGEGAKAERASFNNTLLKNGSNPNGYAVGDLYPTTAVGAGALAKSGTAIGFDAVAGSDDGNGGTNTGTAIGGGAQALGSFSIALSSGANAPAIASGRGSIAQGFDAKANANDAIAIGSLAEAKGVNSVALGLDANALGLDSIAMGNEAKAGKEGSSAGAVNNISIGTRAQTGTTEVGGDGGSQIAIGTDAKTDTLASIAIGKEAETGVGQHYGIALGGMAKGTGNSAIAVGRNAQASGQNSMATGNGAQATQRNAWASGRDAQATAQGAIALGYETRATGIDSLAMGTGAIASGEKSISIGYGNQVSGNGSGAIGDPSYVTGAGTYTIGNDNGTLAAPIAADNAGAFGNDNLMSAAATGSRIIGNGNDLDVADAFVMGNSADVTFAGGVALGSSSVASTGSGVRGYDISTNGDAANGSAIANTQSTNAAVSVGDATNGIYRQITGVAAGAEDSDAVNVAQLKAVADNRIKLNAGNNTYVTPVFASPSVCVPTAEVPCPPPGPVDPEDSQLISYTIDADGTTVSAGSTAVSVVGTKDDITKVTDYAVDLSQDAKDSLVLADSSIQEVVTQIDGNPVKTLTKTDNNANFVTGKNIKLTDDGKGGIEVATEDEVEFTQITVGDATNNTVITSTADGLDVGGDKITNVADGDISNTSTDAVNGSQLFTTNQNVTNNTTNITKNTDAIDKGFNIAADNGTDDNVKLGDTVTYTSADGNVITTVADNEIDFSLASSINVGTTNTVTIDGDAGTIGGLTNTTFDPNNFTSGQAASEDQLKQVSDVANAGWNVKVNGTAADNVAPGEEVQFVDGQNITITRDSDQVIKVATTPDLTADSLTINGGPVINNTGINMGGNTITNLKAINDPNSAATVGQLTELYEGTNTTLVSAKDVDTGQNLYRVDADGTTVSAGSAAVTVAASTKDPVTNLTDYAVDISQGTKDQIDGALQEVVTQIDGTDVKTLTKTDNNANFVTGKNIKLTDDGKGGIEVATADDVEFTNVNVTNQLDVAGDTNIGGNTTILGDTRVEGDTYLGDNFSVVNNEAIYTGQINNDNSVVNKAYVDGKETHYYSWNDNGLVQGNYDNDGATGVNSLAAGIGTQALGDNSTAVGYNAKSDGVSSVAVGDGANAQGDENVALGSGSYADGTTVGTAAYQPLDAAGNPVAVTAPTADSEVSVGSAGKERRITNVAAGGNDTDAVNVSQLKAVRDIASTGSSWDIQVNKDTVDTVAPGEKVQFIDGQNIAITRDGDQIIKVATTPALTAD